MKKVLAFFMFMFSFELFAQINVVSPVEGVWSNKQMLIIDTDAGGEYFYSLNGEDPETSGFAYDGPVLIDMTGEVKLRIKKAGKRKNETIINYTVVPDIAYSYSYNDFISTFFQSGVINYTSGTYLYIPSELKYSLGSGRESYMEGEALYVSDTNVFNKPIPCIVFDPVKNKKWRFIINTYPQLIGSVSKREVPFEITNWDKITFTDDYYIYRIDSNHWQMSQKTFTIDRSVSHTIYWQSVNYNPGNPIESFVLPPKPVINQETDENGGLLFTLEGDESYLMSIPVGLNNEYEELYSVIGIDTFEGNNLSGVLNLGLFSNSVYQGTIPVDYSVKKRLPAVPEITSSASDFYSRNNVSLEIEGETDSVVYYSISEPFVVKGSSEEYKASDSVFEAAVMKDFVAAEKCKFKLDLEALDDGAVYYKVKAYSVSGDYCSPMAEYSVLIDKYNFYVDERYCGSIVDGTKAHPFNSFKDCLEVINNVRYARLRVAGPVIIHGNYTLESNCEFINEGAGELVFTPNSSLTVENSSLILTDCNISMMNDNPYSQSKILPVIKLKNSVLDMTNTQIVINFGKTGNFIEAYQSTVNIFDSIASVSSSSYASFMSAVKSRVNVKNSNLSVTSSTCVVFALTKSTANIKNNSFKVTGDMGRICELFSTEGEVSENTMKAEVENLTKSVSLYKDKYSKVVELKNECYGF